MSDLKCYAVTIPMIPMFPNRRIRKFLNWITDLDGFLAFRGEAPVGTLVLFKTAKDAKNGRLAIAQYPKFSSVVGYDINTIYVKDSDIYISWEEE